MRTAHAALSLLWLLGTGCGLESYKLDDTASGGEAEGDEGGSGGLGEDTDTGLTGSSGSGGSGSGSAGSAGSGSGDSGSGSAGDESGGSSAGDDGVEPIDLAIDSLSPDYGITAGGDLVTITGGPFDSSAVVELAGEEATVSSVSETELVIVTPAVSRDGTAQVTVTTDAGSARRGGAFRYWDDARGQYGLIGAMELARYTGGYWDGGTPDDLLSTTLYFSEPHVYRWYELFVPTLESCRSESYTSSVAISVFDPGSATVSLRPTSGSTLTLAYDGLGFSVDPTSITAGARYDLVAPGGILPSEDVPAVVQVPSSGPSVSSPAISGSSPPYVSQYQTFRWTSSGADWVLIAMSVDNGTTTSGFETVYCAVVDDGSFTFDGSQFTLWPSVAVALISVSFVYDQSGATLPWNQGLSSMAGMHSTVGGAYTY